MKHTNVNCCMDVSLCTMLITNHICWLKAVLCKENK